DAGVRGPARARDQTVRRLVPRLYEVRERGTRMSLRVPHRPADRFGVLAGTGREGPIAWCEKVGWSRGLGVRRVAAPPQLALRQGLSLVVLRRRGKRALGAAAPAPALDGGTVGWGDAPVMAAVGIRRGVGRRHAPAVAGRGAAR